jgi:uncharacterized membrane protein YqgA involved in biofilm formation
MKVSFIMIGLGTIINCGAIIVGGICGLLFGRFLKEDMRDSLIKVCGISTIFIAIAGALETMLNIENNSLVSGGSLLIVGCLALGTFIGELLNIENAFERFGEWLKCKTGNAKDKHFVEAFVVSSLTVCIGAMAIVGAIEDGISGDFSILATKAVLDLIIIMVMTCAMGKGCIFSAIPVGILQGSITLLARFVSPIMTETALSNLSMIGSILIFCVGVNLVWGKKIRVANMLPAVILAILVSFIPF